MLSPADAALVARDPTLPGLAVLFDDGALTELVGAPVSRRYLRYKPGTSCVLGATAEIHGRVEDIFVTAYDGGVKVDKILTAADPGQVIAVDAAGALVAARATADRDLPALSVLADRQRRRKLVRQLVPESRGRRKASLTTLSYKPSRRWVGVLGLRSGPVVLRAYRPADAAVAAAALQQMAGSRPETSRLLGSDPDLGLLAVGYVTGDPLDEAVRRGAAGEAELAAAGQALAQLHERSPSRLTRRTGEDDAAAVRTAAEQIAVLLPEEGPAARRLAVEIGRRLTEAGEPSATIHGDFSLDQVVLRTSGGVTLLDLDRAVQGEPAADLGSLAAAVLAGDVVAGRPQSDPAVLRHLHEGYAGVRPLPDAEAVSRHTAALLLRRSVEPFRLCLADWPRHCRALLAAAGDALDAVSPVTIVTDWPGRPVGDLVAGVLGSPVRLEVLKDKPARRRTSRAHGSHSTAIVKVYASGRAPVVAARLAALRDGPVEPVLPRVLLLDEARHLLVLSDVPGAPFRQALLSGDSGAAERVGRALATWHDHHRGRVPTALRPHGVEREVEILERLSAAAPPLIAGAVAAALPELRQSWPTDTVVHRDLYEEQVVLGDRVGLIDLDDASGGPAELDLGNLVAHITLLGRRRGVELDSMVRVLLAAYAEKTPVDLELLRRCTRLSLLRLACLHRDAALPTLATDPDLLATAGAVATAYPDHCPTGG